MAGLKLIPQYSKPVYFKSIIVLMHTSTIPAKMFILAVYIRSKEKRLYSQAGTNIPPPPFHFEQLRIPVNWPELPLFTGPNKPVFVFLYCLPQQHIEGLRKVIS